MIDTATLDAMLTSGCTAEQIVVAVKASLMSHVTTRDERDMRMREAAKLRQQRHRAKISVTRDKRDPRARVEDKPLTLEIEPQEQIKKDSSPSEVRHILSEHLDAETVEAVLNHRKSKKAPVSTPLAARGLVKAFLEFPGGPNAAAEMMVTNGWTGFKRDYWDKGQPRGSPPRPATGLNAITEKFRQELEADGYSNEGEKGRDPKTDARLPLLAVADHRGGR